MSHNNFPLTVYKASAGSGKTFTLATEYIKLLVRNPLKYRQILAVTFTNKATDEMKMRILTHLYGIWRSLPESEGYAKKVYDSLGGSVPMPLIAQRAGEALRLLLHNYSYFRVETIDSFFQSVLRNLARELNQTSNLRVGLNDYQVEELAVDKLIDSLSPTDVVLQWLMRYIMDNISDDRSWNVIGQIKKFGQTIFSDTYKANRQHLEEVIHQPHFFDEYQKLLRGIRKQSLQVMTDIADEFFSELAAASLTVDDFSYGKSGVAGLFIKLQSGVFDETVLTNRINDCALDPSKWCRTKHPRREEIEHLAATTLGELLRRAIDEQPRQWKLFKSADLTLRHLSQLRLLSSIDDKVRELNSEHNRFLLSDTQQLLHELIDGSDSPFIFEKIGSLIDHVMIDEFQDTSTVQWQNFKVLLQDAMSRSGAENLIVGDVKQSISRWRSGDWRLLAGIKGQFADADAMVNVETLATNYRSSRRVVDFNNAFFTEAARIEQVTAYDDVCQQIPAGRADNGRVEMTLLPAADYDTAILDALSGKVAELIASGIAPSGIAILVRSNNHIPVIARHFAEHLPTVRVVSDEAFRLDASPAVVSIVEALRLLATPDHSIAKAYLKKTTGFDADDEASATALSALHKQPLTEQVQLLYNLLSLDRLPPQSAYLCAFFDNVTNFAADNGSDIDAFIREWDDSIRAKTIQSPENDGLRIISIHKSKGLEFDSVLIPYCDWRLELPDMLWCTPAEEPFSRLPLVPVDYSQKGMRGTIYADAYDEEHSQNIVDNLNLLYVGFTRAAKQLFVYGKRDAGATSRSALLEQVLPVIAEQLPDATLTGTDNEEEPLAFTFGTPPPASQLSTPTSHLSPLNSKLSTLNSKLSTNPFLQDSATVKVPMEVLAPMVDFKQSNQSRLFTADSDTEPEPSAVSPDGAAASPARPDYIELGSVMHNVLSTIRTADDVDGALRQLESDGVISTAGSLTPQRLADMLRRRLATPRVAEWFQPGRWQLFNECTILSLDAASGRVAERRPDRVMTDGRQTIVVDFKFGRERSEYHEQVRQYIRLLDAMGMPGIKGYLWLVYSNKIIEVL